MASLASLGIVFPDPARLPACPARLADKISSPSHWWSIGTRVVCHLLRVSPGAPTNLACEGRVACLNGLVRGACQPRFVDAALRTHNHPAAFVAGARHVPVGRTVLAECVPLRRDALRDSAGGTRLERRLPRRHGWHPWRGARLRKDQDRSTGKLLADTRAPSSLRRARCGRTPTQVNATACDLDSAHAPLLATTHPMNCRHP